MSLGKCLEKTGLSKEERDAVMRAFNSPKGVSREASVAAYVEGKIDGFRAERYEYVSAVEKHYAEKYPNKPPLQAASAAKESIYTPEEQAAIEKFKNTGAVSRYSK